MPAESTPTAAAAALLERSKAGADTSGWDTSLDADFEAALAKDDAARGIAPIPPTKPNPTTPPAPAPTKPDPKPPEPEVKIDLPDALFQDPKPSAATPTDAEKQAAREKEIAEQTKGMSPKASERFRALEAKMWEAEQKAARAAELEKEIQALKNAPPPVDPKEYEELKKKHEEMDAYVQKTRIENHPSFKANFDAKVDGEMEGIKARLPDAVAVEVEQLLKLPPSKYRDSKINDAISELDDFSKGSVITAASKIDDINRERKRQLDNWKENAKKMTEIERRDQEAALAQAKARTEQAWRATESRIRDAKDGLELFREVEGNEEWNKTVKERFTKARELFSTQITPEVHAELAVMAAAAPKYRELFYQQRAVIQQLQTKLASLQSAEPQLKPGEGTRDPARADTDNFVDAVIREATASGLLK